MKRMVSTLLVAAALAVPACASRDADERHRQEAEIDAEIREARGDTRDGLREANEEVEEGLQKAREKIRDALE